MTAFDLWTRLMAAATPKQQKRLIKLARKAFGRSLVDSYLEAAQTFSSYSGGAF